MQAPSGRPEPGPRASAAETVISTDEAGTSTAQVGGKTPDAGGTVDSVSQTIDGSTAMSDPDPPPGSGPVGGRRVRDVDVGAAARDEGDDERGGREDGQADASAALHLNS